MRIGDVLRFAATELRRNKGRSALTATGVAVGVFAFTTIVAIGQGLDRAVNEQLTDDESPTRIVVRPGAGAPARESLDAALEGVTDPAKADRLRKAMTKRRRAGGGGPGGMRRRLLTPDVVAALSTRAHVTAVRPIVVDRFETRLGEHHAEAAISYGIAPGDPRWDVRVLAGAPFTAGARGVWLHEYLLYTWGYKSDADQAALVGREVALRRPPPGVGMSAMLEAARSSGLDLPIDPRLVETFARGLGPRGKGELEGREVVTLPVLGIVRERIEADGFEVWEDSFSMHADLLLPQAVAEALFLNDAGNLERGYGAVTVEVSEPRHVAPLEADLKAEGYRTISIASMLERVGRILAIVTVFVGGLTAIAVFVAVLGIVNTMVMNVSERTREIGTLKALGATDGQVRGLFVAESALIGLAGGAAGLIGALLAQVPGDFAARQAILRMTEYVYPGSIFAYPLWLLGSALGFALLLSVLAALGPAGTAARVDPVVALRDE